MTSLEKISLNVDEFEALRLGDFEGLEQTMAAESMGISQPTFHRTIESGRKKVADALVNGKAIRIEGGDYVMARDNRKFRCSACEFEWEEPHGTARPVSCPKCASTDFHRAMEDRGHSRFGRGRGC